MPNLAQPKLWTDNQELLIVKGVYKVPSDTNSVELGIDSINLLDEKSGVSLAPDGGWTPQYPSLEGSGVWADTPLMVGRTPLILTEGNVIEKMRLNIVASSTAQMLAIKAKFSLFLKYARDFWTEPYQINPVFIHWFASCGAGRQYASIYNMELDWDDKDSPAPTSVLTLTIEREPYWRWLPPGASPKQWTQEWNSQLFDAGIIANTDLSQGLISGSDALTKSEFAANSTSLTGDNCITIPASQIPGDAPALLELDIVPSPATRPNIIIGKKTTKITQRLAGGSGTFIAQNTIVNATDGTLGTDATRANDTGAVKAIGAGTAQRVEISFATATNQLRWRALYTSGGNQARINRFIGRWMVFLRCRQSTGSVGDITMYLRFGSAITADTDGVKLNVVNPPVIAGTGNSTNWGLVYMGVVNIPSNPAKVDVNAAGRTPNTLVSNGLDNRATQIFDYIDFGLFAARTAGASLLYLCDLILIPIDEGSIQIEHIDATLNTVLHYDESGYFSHGLNDIFVGGDDSPLKVTGVGIQLTPGVENRLYIMSYDGSNQSQTSDSWTYDVHIIPRSRGIRDRINIYG